MSSTFGNTQNVPAQAISSDFERRFGVVGGFRESRLSPDNNPNGCDRQWMSSSIQVISKECFLRCKSVSWAAFENGSRLSELEAEAFSESGLTSIHLPSSVTVIGESCFSDCGSLASITFDPPSTDLLAGQQLGQTDSQFLFSGHIRVRACCCKRLQQRFS
jgi:hypothetical protein